MDTFIWGPPTWKLLHSLSFADPSQLFAHRTPVMTFLNSLGGVLPCVYCRDSYVKFVSELPDLEETLRRGQLARWMYELHAKVNRKLGELTPDFSRVQKRYTMRPVQWCPRDVWDMVTLFGMNYTDEKRGVYIEWWDSLRDILPLAGATETDMHIFRDMTCPGGCNEFMVVSTLLADKSIPTREKVLKRAEMFDMARAKACKKGVCK